LWREMVLNLRSSEFLSAVLTSRPPGQPAGIYVRTILKLSFLLCYRELSGGSCSGLVICSLSVLSFTSVVILFSFQILKGSDHGI
jgi:hypothetical protein